MSDELMTAAVAAVRRDPRELVDLLGELVRTRPVYGSPGQQDALQLCEHWLRNAGFDVLRPLLDVPAARTSPDYCDVAALGGRFADYDLASRPCVIGRCQFSADGPHVILNAHIDVEFVPDPSTWSVPGRAHSGEFDGERVWGRGTSDMLGGAAAYLYVLDRLAPLFERARGSLTVQLVLDEELGGNGTLGAVLLDPPRRGSVALIAEPTNGVVAVSSRGFAQFHITCRGRAGHMCYSVAADNAYLRLAEVIRELEATDEALRIRSGDRHRFLTYGLVRGDADPATPAEHASLVVTAAPSAGVPLALILSMIDDRLAVLRARYGDPMPVEPYGLALRPGRAASPAAARDLAATAAGVGVSVAVGEFPSACDARLFDLVDTPAIVYGPGDLARAHGADEYVTLDELVDYCAVLGGTLARWWDST